jgi:hypothetical protein
MPDKEEVELLDERIISNRGLIAHTPDPLFRRFWLQTDIIRLPQTNFVNKNVNPDIGDYGRITFMRQGQVLRIERIQFDQQVFIWDVDSVGYIAKYLKCAFEATFELLGDILTALSVPIVPGTELLAEPIEDQFDQILFVIRPDAAIATKLYGLKYDVVCESSEPKPTPPPPPPEFPNYPPGTPLEDTDTPASPPYSEPNDGGDTVPLPGDSGAEPPPPIPGCTSVIIRISYTQTLANGDIISGTRNYPGKAEVVDVFAGNFVSGGSDIFVVDRLGGSNTCRAVPAQRSVNRGVGTFAIVSWSVTPT